MSGGLAYGLGVLTPIAAVAAFLIVDEARTTGRKVICDRHGWNTGDLDTTRRWRLRLRLAWHRATKHRHGERWDLP